MKRYCFTYQDRFSEVIYTQFIDEIGIYSAIITFNEQHKTTAEIISVVLVKIISK